MEGEPRLSFADGLYGAELERRINEAAATIRARLAAAPELAAPRLAIILGSGLGSAVDLLDPAPRLVIPYREIPHVPVTTVAGHAGDLVAGTAAGIQILVLSGRVHGFEGWSHRQATLLLRACLTLGIEILVVFNSSGGINADFEAGDVMLISDTINLSGDNPLIGPHLDSFGPRFVAMADAFDRDLRVRAQAAARRAGVTLREGVYAMLSGPAYETRAELRMLRTLGVDAVGMSTVPDVLVARQAGVRVLAFSVISNKATPEMEGEVTHEEVLATGPIGAARLLAILRELLPELG